MLSDFPSRGRYLVVHRWYFDGTSTVHRRYIVPMYHPPMYRFKKKSLKHLIDSCKDSCFTIFCYLNDDDISRGSPDKQMMIDKSFRKNICRSDLFTSIKIQQIFNENLSFKSVHRRMVHRWYIVTMYRTSMVLQYIGT